MAATTIAAGAPASAAKPWYRILYVQVLIAIVLGALVGWLWPELRHQRLDQGARRRLHQADQDGDRADHLLHRGVGHRPYPGCQEGRPHRRQGAGLFRDRLDVRAGDRPDRRQCGPAGRGLRRRAWRMRARSPATPSRPKRRRRVDFFLHIIPDTVVGAFARAKSCRCCCSRSCSALRSWRSASAATPCAPSSTTPRTRVFGVIAIVMKAAPIGAFGAMAYTIGKFGTGAILQSGRADRDLLPHGGAVRVRGARHHRADRRVLDLQVPRLHQGRAADRARHLVLGKRAAVT